MCGYCFLLLDGAFGQVPHFSEELLPERHKIKARPTII
jgi:hypothetical protein